VAIQYIDFKEAKAQQGLRLVAVSGIPSPWAEAAKAILHIKEIPFSAVYHDPFNKEMASWVGSGSAPAAIYNEENPVSGWSDILMLAERLSSSPALLPSDPDDRALALQLSHQICGEQGLGWWRRLDSVHKGLTGQPGGFPEPVSQYLASKYGYQKDQVSDYVPNVINILNLLSERLKQQRDKGQKFYVGSSISAVDLYSATFMAYFKPLPQDQCPMLEYIRPVFESLDEPLAEALDPILIEHRDFIYDQYLELPLSL